ncbi:MAG: ABC transporter permease subunit [Thermoplasmatales archaeon]|nr:ABC transporter permease subunit [Thermoplasmatales archaeon]
MRDELTGICNIAKKEFYMNFKTKRLLVIGIILGVVFISASTYGGILIGGNPDEPLYKQGPNTVLGMVLSITSIFPAILAIALSYDSIVGERVKKSIYLLLSKPVSRNEIFCGKFLGAFSSIAVVYVAVLSIGYICIIGVSGVLPSAGDVLKACGALGLILLCIACWAALAMFFSTLFKTTTSCLIVSIVMWLFIIPIISQIGVVYYAVTTNALTSYGFKNTDFPWYAKMLYAINPDNCMSAYSNILGGVGQTMRVLSTKESLTGMVLFFIVVFILGLYIFGKTDLD